jgi:ABC-type polysaccharide/polyol phosphate transport system ATPase subunit
MTESIVCRNVSKRFTLRYHRTLKQMALASVRRQDLSDTFLAVNDVSFTIEQGESIGLMGLNGSGKSTLLKLINGIMRPDAGEVLARGRIAGLIATGAGFHAQLSGRDNIFLNAAVLGLTEAETRAKFDEIVDFADIGKHLDSPVGHYSSGMFSRLGFAVAIHVDPEVLLIDEVLAVGDEAFTRKCLDKISEFRRRGKTILFVTHSLGLVEKMCDDVLWLNQGRSRGRGDPKRVVDEYLTYVAGGEEALLRSRSAQDAAQADAAPAAGPPEDAGAPGAYRPGRWGSREVEIQQVRLLDAGGRERHVFVPGETLTLALSVRAASPVGDFVFGIGLFAADGTCVYGTNTDIEDFTPRRLQGESEVRLTLEGLRLVEGTYLVDLAAHKRDGTPYDYLRGLHSFRVKSRVKDTGIYRPQHHWSFTGGAELDRPQERSELDIGE